MPIKITDYEWNQNYLSTIIKFGLKNCCHKNIDIVCTSKYLKVNFNPYIFEVFLCHKIDPEQSSSIIIEGNLHLHLVKSTNEDWKSLEIDPKSKEEAQNLRTVALKEYEELVQRKDKQKKEGKAFLERLAVTKQISLNEEKHLKCKGLIKQEEVNFFKEEKSTETDNTSKENRMRLSSFCSEDGSTVASEGDYDGDEESVNFSSSENLSGMIKNGRRPRPEQANEKIVLQNKENSSSIRKSSCIKIRHTFCTPTPRRESVESSQREEPRNEDDATSVDEKENLKCEAIKCFDCGDYDGAVKAYSALVDRWPSQVSHYSNRAAALLALKCYEEAIKDCTKALELLTPPTEENAKSRLLCHVRRGTSYAHLQDLSSALMDFETAFQLDPNNSSLAKDVTAIKASLNHCTTDTGDESSESQSSYEEEDSACLIEDEGNCGEELSLSEELSSSNSAS